MNAFQPELKEQNMGSAQQGPWPLHTSTMSSPPAHIQMHAFDKQFRYVWHWYLTECTCSPTHSKTCSYNMLQVRLLAVSVAVLAAARFSPAYLSSKALGFVHLIAFGTFLGTNIWTTFVAGLTMFKNLPRQVQICPLLRCCPSN